MVYWGKITKEELNKFSLLRDVPTDEKQTEMMLRDRKQMYDHASAYLQHHDKNVKRMAEFILWLFTT